MTMAGIGYDEFDCKRDEPFAGVCTPGRNWGGGPERALSEPRFDHKRIGEAADADDDDDRKQQGPPCRQDEVIADVGNGLKADKGQKQAESEQRGDRRVL